MSVITVFVVVAAGLTLAVLGWHFWQQYRARQPAAAAKVETAAKEDLEKITKEARALAAYALNKVKALEQTAQPAPQPPIAPAPAPTPPEPPKPAPAPVPLPPVAVGGAHPPDLGWGFDQFGTAYTSAADRERGENLRQWQQQFGVLGKDIPVMDAGTVNATLSKFDASMAKGRPDLAWYQLTAQEEFALVNRGMSLLEVHQNINRYNSDVTPADAGSVGKT